LYESPFTDFDSNGVDGVFDPRRCRAPDPAGRMRGSRNRLSEAVICALLMDFSKHGEKAIAKVRRTQPAAYLKICALLVPRDITVEHSGCAGEAA
jgi:hypothetical protein